MATVAKQQYHWDDRSIIKVERTMEVEPWLIEKISTIEEWAEKNKIQTIKVNWVTVPVSPDDRSVDLTVPHVIDDFYSTSEVDALSANMWRALSEEIMHLKSIWRFLSLWSCELWMPTTQPPQWVYKYKTWDYFIITRVAWEWWTNYRPEWKQYAIWDVSQTVETEEVKEWDTYFYDWENWTLQVNTTKEIQVDDALSLTSENPVQNKVITAKVNEISQNIPTLVSQLENDTGFITEEAIPDISVKVDKTSTANQVYGTDGSWNETTYEIAWWVKSNTVVLRWINWVVWVWTPTADNHAATKKYVDEVVENVNIDVDDELSNTSINPVQNKVITEKINELELLKTPNATIIWSPTIVAGNISNFSASNYLIAPFLSSFAQNPFIIHMDFTTSSDITTQQNIVDSEKWLAFAIRNKRFVVALSTDWSSWLWEFVWSNVVLAGTNYHVEIEWTWTQLLLRYSTDWTNYTTDITADLTAPLSGKVLYFGWHWEAAHPFKGVFNFNEWRFKSLWNIVWRWMDAAGLETRANLSLNNLDEEGNARFDAKQDVIDDLQDIKDWASKWATALQPGTTSDDIQQWLTNLFLTSNEREKLGNTEGINTGDETLESIKEKLWTAWTTTDGYLTKEDYAKFNNKQPTISDLDDIRSWAALGKTALQTETDPVFTNSPAWTITQDNIVNWNWKQDVITDLATIRAWAAKGNTALQTETDPIFNASPAKNITNEEIEKWNSTTSANDATITINAQITWKVWEFTLNQNSNKTITIPIWQAHKPGLVAWGNWLTINQTTWKMEAGELTREQYDGANGMTFVGKTTLENRLVSKQDVISDLATIRSWAALWATALQSFTETDPTVPSHVKGITTTDISNWNSKQASIEDLATIRAGAALGKTALQSETDPIFTASAASWITSWDISNWNWKQNAITDLATIRAGAELGMTALQEYTETDPVFTNSPAGGIKTTDINNWNNKQNAISDLATIRSWAALWATALQSYTETDPLYTADKPNIALKSEIPDISGKLDKTQIASAEQDWVLSKEDFATFSAKQNAITDLEVIRDGASKWATAVQPAVLNSFATLLDLSNWLKNKQDKALVTTLTNADDEHYPSAKAVADAMSGAGFWDMLKSTYDPNNVWKNAFDYNNFINTPTIVDNVTTDSSTSVLSAKQWKLLQDQIDTLEARGHFLSNWNATNWQPESFPLATPYTYTTWDYYIVTVVWSNNKRPAGTAYDWKTSTVSETEELAVWDVYTYDWQIWLLQVNHWKTVSFSNLSWDPTDNANLASALNSKQPLIDDLDTIRTNASTWGTAKTAIDTHVANTTIHVTASDKVAWSKKQEAISDLETIRSNAALWATALQPGITTDDVAQGTTNLYFTSAERTKLAWITWTNTWDETASSIKTKLWITTLSWSNTWDETTNTIKTKLGVASANSDGYLSASDFQTFAWKQNTISDLATIRSNAEKWATAVQPWDLATVATSWDYEDLINKPENIHYVLTEGTDYTVEFDATKWVAPYNTSYGYTNVTITNTEIKETLWWIYTFLINAKPATSTYRNVRVRFGTSGAWYGLWAYNSVSAQYSYFTKAHPGVFVLKPSVNTNTTEKFFSALFVNTTYSSMTAAEIEAGTSTTARLITPANLKTAVETRAPVKSWDISNFYTKPNWGIPKTDLASAVQTSLGKADTALQSFTETDPTVPSHVKSITQANITAWNWKQDAISDLATIRSNASAVTSKADDSSVVHLDWVETIIWEKQFNNKVKYTHQQNYYAHNQWPTSAYAYWVYQWWDQMQYTLRDASTDWWMKTVFWLDPSKMDVDWALNVTWAITWASIVKSGWTSSQFLKADGSVDSNTYLTSETDPTVPSHVKSITSTDISNWNWKQDTISDLATIRDWASKWATAIQPNTDAALNSLTSQAESVFTHAYYCPNMYDNAPWVWAAFKWSRTAYNQTIVGNIIAPYASHDDNSWNQASETANQINFQRITWINWWKISSVSTLATLDSNWLDVKWTIKQNWTALIPSGWTAWQVLTKTSTWTAWQDTAKGWSSLDVLLQTAYDNLSDAEKMDWTFRFIYIEQES